MIKILLLLIPLLFLSSNDQAKLIYIKQEKLYQNDSQIYVGQTIAIKYNVLILDNASIDSIGFLDSTKSTTIKNPNSSWNELSDGSLENTFYFKVNNSSFFIPQLEVIASSNNITDKEITQRIKGDAIALRNNHPKYSGVVASYLKLNSYSVKFYNQGNNIIVLDLDSKYSNLEDFRISDASKQGFERSNFNILNSDGIYYAIVPDNILNVDFEYFNLNSQSYESISIKNIINKDQISVNQHINPMNKAFVFQNLTLIIFIAIFVVLFFIPKIPFKVRMLSIIIALILLLYLLFLSNFKKEAIINNNAYMTILPTNNSTVIEQLKPNIRVEIINSYGDYYKIISSDGKTGWTNKSNIDN